MYLFGKHVNDITDVELKRLIENNIRENKTLDYKREIKIDDDKDKNRQEFLCDITAFYNCDGGCIIYGIEEQKDSKQKNTGYPGNFTNQQGYNKDKLEQQIHDIIHSNTDPVISNVVVRFLTVDNCELIIIGIPKGMGLPAMVTINGINKFFRRNAVGKYAVDVYELNQMFMQNKTLKENTNVFIKKRLEDVLDENVYPGVEKAGSFILHAIPLNYQLDEVVDLSLIDMNNMEEFIYPILTLRSSVVSTGYDYGYNYDGFTTFRNNRLTDALLSYNQFFRNGIIEFFTKGLYEINDRDKQNYLYGADLINTSITAIQNAVKVWRFFQIEPPFFVSIYINAPNAMLLTINNSFVKKLTKNEILLPLIYIDKFEINNGELYELMRPYFNIIWQAAGDKSAPTKEQFFSQNLRR